MSEVKERLALHVCCGPCATVCLERLTPRFEVVPIWYNPNICPDEEHERRLRAAVTACSAFDLEIIGYALDHQKFLEITRGLEGHPEGGERCVHCLGLRLGCVAAWAIEQGCELMTTTLTVGPQKNVQMIHAVGREAIRRRGVGLVWLEETFRKADGYHRSVELSEDLGLYRQHYCGCEFSLRED
jgi:predicted adenine nucleotide alpha hydrolase (AANH) superfamily ATPase